LLIQYLQQFDSSFSLIEALESPKVYVAGQISDLHQGNIKPMADAAFLLLQ
jgi:hypothetical protein